MSFRPFRRFGPFGPCPFVPVLLSFRPFVPGQYNYRAFNRIFAHLK